MYSFDRTLALGKGAAGLISGMIDAGNAKALDKYTVQFTLKKPAAIFLAVVPEIHVVNSKLLESHEKDGDWGSEWLTSHDAGSGSYTLNEYDPAVGFSVKRFEDHFLGWEGDHIDEVEFRVVKELNTRVLGLLKGDYHFVGGYFPEEQLKRLEASEEVNVLNKEYMRLFLFHLHNQRAPLDDVHVRRAVNYAFDYDSFLSEVMKGEADRNKVPIPNNLWGVPKDIEGYSFDLAKAKAELVKAQAKIDRPLEITFFTGFSVPDLRRTG